MYHLDPNLNTAIERQADRVRAVRALSSSSNSLSQPAIPTWTIGPRQSSRIAAQLTLALVVAGLVVLGLILVFGG